MVMKNHYQREDHPADAIRLREGERLVTWTLPARPSWMSKEEYKQQPATLELRLIDVNVHRNGFRPSQFTVTTTMTDDEQYSGNWIRSIYESRWLVELDIRSIKCSLNPDLANRDRCPIRRHSMLDCVITRFQEETEQLETGQQHANGFLYTASIGVSQTNHCVQVV